MSLSLGDYWKLCDIENRHFDEIKILRAISEKQDKQIEILEHLVTLLERREDDGKQC